MTKQTFGATISALRKEKGLTQLELARQMGVTDKAVSKWERNARYLDKLVDELARGRALEKVLRKPS